MPDEEENLEKKEKFNEQTEAFICAELRKNGNMEARSTNFKVRLDIYKGLITKGVSQPTVDRVVGKFIIEVSDDGYGTEIYQAALEIALENIYQLWRAYLSEMSEQVFIDVCGSLKFVIHI